jgi:Tol biopolymer transport system component
MLEEGERHMKSMGRIVALFFLIAALGIGMAPQNAYDLFQKALTKEKAEGNLEEAIALFQQVVARGEDESLAARAQLHIGMCHEKLGLGRARESYQKVIDRYPKQAEAVKAAREKLASLVSTRMDKPGGSREINMRRVYDGTGLEWGNALSSDGRNLVYTDWETGDMAIVDMVTKQHRRLTNTGGLKTPSGDMGETSVFSPDDKKIAYGWMVGAKIAELRVVNFDGTEPRVLLRDEQAVWIRPHDWSNDGKNILIVLMRKDNSSDIAIFSLARKKADIVRHVPAKGPEMSLSPDGTMIAYSMPQEPGSSKRDLYVMKADGLRHEAIVAHLADDYLLGWTPDGRQVLFASDRTGSYGIWGVQIAEGRAEGLPHLIKGDLMPFSVKLTPDGTLYYQLSERLMEVYTVAIDPETGKPLAQPAPVKSRHPGNRQAPDWSPDGTRLAYRSYLGNEPKPDGPALISVLDLRSGEETRIAAGLGFNRAFGGPRWSPDGRSVMCIGSRGEEQGIFQIEIPGGATKFLVKFPPNKFTLHAAWSRDGKSIFYPQGNPVQILRRDLASGQDVELATMKGPAGTPRIALSPDGKWLAFLSLDIMKDPLKLMIVSADGGPAREIFRTKGGEYIQWLQWTPDGRSIWLKKYTPPADPKLKPTFEFLSVSPEGSAVRKLDLSIDNGLDFRIHPDGRQIAFSLGQGKVELWALENFLPPVQK